MYRENHILEEKIRSRFLINDYVKVCDRAFRLGGQGILKNLARREIVKKLDGLDFFRIEMSALWPERYQICKIIEESSDLSSGRLGSRTAVINLEDLRANRKITLDADHITDMRTGAAGALGIKYLSNQRIKHVSIVGTGRVAGKLAMAMDWLFAPGEIIVVSRKKKNVESFIKTLGPVIKARLHSAETVAECVKNTDAILTAVPAQEPVLSLEHLRDGVPISVMAGDPRSRQISSEILESKGVIVDNLKQAYASGEFVYAKKGNRLEKIKLLRGEIGEVLTIGDLACGRFPRNREVEIAYFTGLAALDLLVSVMIYEDSQTRLK